MSGTHGTHGSHGSHGTHGTSGAADRLIGRLEARYAALVADAQRAGGATTRHAAAWALRVAGAAGAAGDRLHVFGSGEPAFTIVVRDREGLAALRSLDITAVGEAYLRGAVDVEGELWRTLALRDLFSDRDLVRRAWHFLRPLFHGQVASDKYWIAHHYEYPPEFYLLFLDRQYRCYSHGVFARDDEPLESAIARKLDFAAEAAGIRPGMRVLDIGGGWGAFVEYGGRRGIHVTSLTISEESERFIQALIDRQRLPCRVVREHLYEHRPGAPYDAIVNLGVTEHLPDYRATLQIYERLLKPGGRIYLDASAARKRHDLSTFLLRYIFPGNGTPLCLHEYLAEVARSRFSVAAVHNDRHNYLLTTKHWAQRLEDNRAEIERRWGKAVHRVFQLYLWGCVDGFLRDTIQAYRVVLELG
ncbi:MAG TPA: class I SAM-dependent methyltransferase [Gemmatimonadaceae bacterium]|nr:class I SAM-dependent methyltransferase [Gemmatimonadaceae bacterium]